MEALEDRLGTTASEARTPAAPLLHAFIDISRLVADVALSKSLQLKEERIQVLETRLADANKQIDAFRTVRCSDCVSQHVPDSVLAE